MKKNILFLLAIGGLVGVATAGCVTTVTKKKSSYRVVAPTEKSPTPAPETPKTEPIPAD